MDFEALSTKYRGENASTYTQARIGSKWMAEHQAVEELLAHVPNGVRTLDVPVGTGRLIPFAKAKGFDAYGLDISPDMLAEARAQAEQVGAKVHLAQGDIRKIDFPDNHFDLVTCLRFLNWIGEEGVEQATRELVRVSRDKLLLGVRYVTPFAELGWNGSDLLRFGMRSIGFPRYRARRWGLVYHDKEFVDSLFRRLKLSVIDSRLVERRWDGTDYVFFLLHKG